NTSASSLGVSFYFKANCAAGETAPTITNTAGTFCAAVLTEFSGAATTSPVDQDANPATGLTSPQTVTLLAADVAAGDLMLATGFYVYTMAGTKTTSDTYNNATATAIGNNDATSTVNHYRFSYGITTTNASADNDAAAFTITNISSVAVNAVSFKAGALAAVVHPFSPLPFIPQGRSF